MQSKEDSLIIRKVTEKDIREIQGLIKGVLAEEFPEDSSAFAHYDIDDPVSYYGGDNDVFLVAEKDGDIVGTVAIKEDSPHTALLRRIFLKKEYRGKGYGDLLLGKAMEFCFEHDYQSVVFRGTTRMQGALKLCLKRGFREEDITIADDFKMCLLTKALDKKEAISV